MIRDVSVPERGFVGVDAETWRALEADETFWSLVDRKVLNVNARRDGSAVISAGSSVGFARCGDVTIRVREKVPGALQALINRRLAGVRSYRIPGVFTREDTLVEHIVLAFADAVARYVAGGRHWTYERVRRQGSVIGGRLLVRDTLALRARGRPQIAAFDKREITHLTPVNQCVTAALRVTEDLYLAGLLGESAITGARALAPFFHDNNTVEVLYGAPERHAARAADLAESLGGEISELLHLAAVLLSGAGMAPLGDAVGHLPITWFINLEDAFEAAVRDVFGEQLRGSWLVEKGGDRAYLFPAVSHLNVDPDLVLTRLSDGDRVVVGDVKYKNLEGRPAASDLYQLLAHATSLTATTAFLVFPGDSYQCSRLGMSSTGVAVDVFTIDVRDVDGSIQRIIASLLGS